MRRSRILFDVSKKVAAKGKAEKKKSKTDSHICTHCHYSSGHEINEDAIYCSSLSRYMHKDSSCMSFLRKTD